LSHRATSRPPRRHPSRRAVRFELLAFVEGKPTEDMYLVYWRRRYRDSVLVAIADFHGTPLELARKAAEAKDAEAYEAKRGRGRAHDEIWCVFDRDEHPYIPEAMEHARQHGVHVAFSNPCLELWFLLHFQDRKAFLDRHDAQRRSASFLHCSKSLTDVALDELFERYDNAKARAVGLHEWHLGNGTLPPDDNPSSSIWRLLDRIRDPRGGTGDDLP
jgi:hypothetical protein